MPAKAASIHLRTLCAGILHAVHVVAALQSLYDFCEFLLQRLYPFLHDLVWIKAADRLDVVEKATGDCVVVEGFVFGRGTAVQVYGFFVDRPAID